MAISEETKKMRAALKEIVFPYLREQNFKGTYPHFRRIGKEKVDLMSFQSSRWSSEFTINLAIAPLEGLFWDGNLIPPNKLKTYNSFDHARLTIDEYHGDHWFDYLPSYEAVAYDVMNLIEKRADSIFNRMYHEKRAFESLTPEQYSELEQILKNNIKRPFGYDRRSMRGAMETVVLEYMDGTLKFFMEFYRTLTPEQIEALEWKLKLKYSYEYLSREPAHEKYRYDSILKDLLEQTIDEEAVLFCYHKIREWRCISTNEMI